MGSAATQFVYDDQFDQTGASDGADVWVDGEEFTRSQLEAIASLAPQRLLTLVEQRRLDPADMTFAAEMLGDCFLSLKAKLRALAPLLSDRSPLVREGAVYGLEKIARSQQAHAIAPKIVEVLTTLACDDPSEGVRLAAEDALYATE